MRRREFITLLGSAAAWPLAARAQLTTRMRRVGAVMLLAEDDPQQKAWTEAFLHGLQAVAPSLGVEVVPVNMRDSAEIERTLAAFARSANGGLIVTGSALATTHRDLIIGLAALHKLPAVYYERLFVTAGGLISYGV